MPFIATRLRARRSTSSNTASPGSGMSNSVRANGASRRCQGRIFSSHHVTTSGNDRRRSVSPVGAQSTITQSNSPSSWWRLIQSSENSSSMPGGTVSSSAEMRSTPRSASRSPSQPCTPSQWRSISSWAWTSWPNRFVADLGGLAAERGLERVGQAVRGVGGEHDRAQAGGGAAAGRGGRDARLADAALARVEDGARRHQTPPRSSDVLAPASARPVLHLDLAAARSRFPRPVRSSLAASCTVKVPGPRGVQVNEPSPRRKVARRLKHDLPVGRVTVTCTADSFDTLKRIAAGSSSVAVRGPLAGRARAGRSGSRGSGARSRSRARPSRRVHMLCEELAQQLVVVARRTRGRRSCRATSRRRRSAAPPRAPRARRSRYSPRARSSSVSLREVVEPDQRLEEGVEDAQPRRERVLEVVDAAAAGRWSARRRGGGVSKAPSARRAVSGYSARSAASAARPSAWMPVACAMPLIHGGAPPPKGKRYSQAMKPRPRLHGERRSSRRGCGAAPARRSSARRARRSRGGGSPS